MKIALIGSRGLPARYSGFETFYEELGSRLVKRGHTVTVYNRSHFIRERNKTYRGMQMVYLPSIPSKHLDTITHTALSSLHALFRSFDIAYYCIVGNSPVCWLPRLRGTHTLLNVDGEDWAREKWGAVARHYQQWAEKIAPHTAQVLIADALGVQQRYREIYGRETVFVPYGANPVDRATVPAEALSKWNLKSDEYFLYVGRFVPENAIHTLIKAYRKIRTDRRLVIVGDAPYADEYRHELFQLAEGDERICFTGYAFGDDYRQLSAHAYAAVQPSGVQGTRPALLDQMGFGNCVVVRDTSVNMEVISDCGTHFDAARAEESLRDVLQDLVDDPGQVQQYRDRVINRIHRYYNWEWITDFYEQLFDDLIRKRPLQNYDAFAARRVKNAAPS